MRIRFLWLLSLPMLMLVGAACNSGSFSLSYHEHRPVKVKTYRVRRPVTYVCTEGCRHRHHDGPDVVVIQEHRHGRGHVWDGKHWVAVKEHQPAPIKGKARPDVPAPQPPRKEAKPPGHRLP